MAGVSDFIGTITSSVQKVKEKISTDNQLASRIKQTWQGRDEEAFEEAYASLKKKLSSTQESYGKISGKLSSLQSSIEAAERDKAAKRRSTK